jgi:hypothetical protein
MIPIGYLKRKRVINKHLRYPRVDAVLFPFFFGCILLWKVGVPLLRYYPYYLITFLGTISGAKNSKDLN